MKTSKVLKQTKRTAAILLMLVLCIATSALRAEAKTSEYSLYGSASESKDGVICLTTADTWLRGGMFFNESIPIKKGMTATFEYRVSGGETSSLGYADGFVFILSPSYGLGSNGGALGFPGGQGTYGIEFDSYMNYENNDPGNPHIAIIHNSVSNHIAQKTTQLAKSNSWTEAKVEYKDKN